MVIFFSATNINYVLFFDVTLKLKSFFLEDNTANHVVLELILKRSLSR